MIAEELKQIFEAEAQEREFYRQELKPALDRLEHAENLAVERDAIAQLIAGTAFEETFRTLDASEKHEEDALQWLYKLIHLFHETLLANHVRRRQDIEQLLQKTPASDLTSMSFYYLAQIYSHGDSEHDYEQTHHYLNQALNLHQDSEENPLAHPLRSLLAQNFDRWQLGKTPPQPQKYGTVYADHHDVAKGLKKDHLIRPHPEYQYQRDDLEQARKELGIESLEEQEELLGLKKKP
ncbi:MAG: hypothetical protein NXI01_09470 [Gammaproteobacteria bacterium]|nr:hypothetical protein [Gammaproteobacteria bacterium]